MVVRTFLSVGGVGNSCTITVECYHWLYIAETSGDRKGFFLGGGSGGDNQLLFLSGEGRFVSKTLQFVIYLSISFSRCFYFPLVRLLHFSMNV